MIQPSLIILAGLLASGYCPWGYNPLEVSSAGPYDITGTDDDKYVVVFVAEGFSNSGEDIERFDEKVEFAVQSIVNTPPFRRCAFNFYTVRLVSNQGGADFPLADPVICKDTALDFQFGDTDLLEYGYDEWVLYTPDLDLCEQAAAEATDNYDLVVVLVNETEYGGMSDRFYPVVATSCGTALDSILVHELGHQFGKTHEVGGLEDEYSWKDECYDGVEPEGPNATKETNRDLIKWAYLIESATPVPTSEAVLTESSESQLNAIVGLWEGAFDYKECVYRPQRICMMNQVGDPFCAVCRRALVEVVDAYCPPSSSRFTVTMSWECSWVVTCHLNAVYRIRLPHPLRIDAPPGGWSSLGAHWNSQTDSLRIDLGPLPGVENVKLVDRSGQLIAEGAVGAAFTASVKFALASVWGDLATVHAPYYLTYWPRYCPPVHSFSAVVYLNDHEIDPFWCE